MKIIFLFKRSTIFVDQLLYRLACVGFDRFE